MNVGIGYANIDDSFEAGKIVAEKALHDGAIKTPVLGLAFCYGKTNHKEYLAGIQSVIGNDCPVVGGSVVGIITKTDLSYEKNPCGLMLIESDKLNVRVSSADNIDASESKAGEKMARQFNDNNEIDDNDILLLFYDSTKHRDSDEQPPVTNASPFLLDGVEKGLERQLPIFGAGFVGGFKIESSLQFDGSKVVDESVIGILLNCADSVYSTIMHGCTPLDGIYHTVTKIEGPVLHEINNRPAVDVLNEEYGNSDWQNMIPINDITLGINHGDKFDDFDSNNYVNRLMVTVLPDKKSVLLFEPDIQEGDEIQFMLRDLTVIVDDTRIKTKELLEQIKSDNRKPACALYIDCAGRAGQRTSSVEEEGHVVQAILNEYNVPFLGCYSGVEIAPIMGKMGKSRGLDWTGVLLIITE